MNEFVKRQARILKDGLKKDGYTEDELIDIINFTGVTLHKLMSVGLKNITIAAMIEAREDLDIGTDVLNRLSAKLKILSEDNERLRESN